MRTMRSTFSISLPGKNGTCKLTSLEYDKDFNKLRTIKLPMPMWDGWGLTKNWENQRVFYLSDGSNMIHECDVLNDFQPIKKHIVG